MEGLSAWFARLVVFLLWMSLTSAYYFEDGFDHHYTYSSEADILGKKNITTVLKFEVRALNVSEDNRRLHSLHVNSLVQFADGGFYQNNPKRWDLTKTFLFVTSLNGSIVLVHVHPEDEDELVLIKKAITSIFSVTVREDASTYDQEETDHLGPLSHTYDVKKTQGGKSISRTHFSHVRAERTHEKTLHYNHVGTLHAGEAFDQIRLKEKKHNDKPRVLLQGEKEHKISTSGDVPVIWTAARTQIRLDGKVPHLVQDTLALKIKRIKRKIHEVSKNISKYIQCVHDYPEQGDANRTDCVHSLREILMSLHKEDLKEFGHSVLNVSCSNSSRQCSVERLVFIDIIARIADQVSQSLIVDHVLDREDSTEEELRHVFIHCVGIDRPLMKIIRAVERFCFGSDDVHHGSINVTETQKRACLAVGTLARNLHLNDNSSEAVRLVDKIDAWIAKHEQHPTFRKKRSLHFENDHHYLTSKVTLIHSLGNAGHPRSLDRLISLTSPLKGHHNWRRAAVDGLRHYACDKSASALFSSALKDSKGSVRQAAKHAYLRHPRSTDLNQEYLLLSHNYTWPVVARLRRSILDAVLFQFNLELPAVHWEKIIGNKAIGASFGVHMENAISGAFRPLAGFVDVDLYDKLWAEAHIGLLNFHLDILLIEVCYKGRLQYNMNKFKDFTVGLAENLAGAYDDMAQEIIKPLTTATNKMSSQFVGPGGQTKSNFDPLAQAVKGIPLKTAAALKASVALNELVQKYQSMPWITRLRQVVEQAQTLVEGVNADALNFYKKVSNAAIVALPYAEKEITDATNKVSKLMDKISKYPKQAFAHLDQSRLNFQMGMARIFAANTKIDEATSLLKGKGSSWMSRGDDITSIINSMHAVLRSASTARRRRRRSPSPFDHVSDVRDSGESESPEEIYNKVESHTHALVSILETVRDKEPVALQNGLDKQKLATIMLQNSFKVLQETVQKMKATIQSLFGSKFHPDLPSQRRPPDSRCGKGTYPSDTRDTYHNAGIDLVWNEGWKVVSPVSGMVKNSGHNEVTIFPSDADFQQYEIVISNIRSDVGEGRAFQEGEPLGISAGKNGCKFGHIHLAVRKKGAAHGDNLCFYLDPSPFVDKLQLKPKWHQECKDFTFKHIGQVIDFKHFGSSLFKLVKKTLVRAALDWAKGLALKQVLKLMQPDSPFGNMLRGVMSDIMSKLGPVVSDVKHLFNGIGGAMEGFFSAINIKGLGFPKLGMMMKSSPALIAALPKLKGLLGNASSLLNKLPPGRFKTFATGGLVKRVAAVGMAVIGGKLNSKTLVKMSIKKACPHFKHGFPLGLGHMCSAHKDCLGFQCDVKLPFKRIQGEVTVVVEVNIEETKVDVSLNGEIKLGKRGKTTKAFRTTASVNHHRTTRAHTTSKTTKKDDDHEETTIQTIRTTTTTTTTTAQKTTATTKSTTTSRKSSLKDKLTTVSRKSTGTTLRSETTTGRTTTIKTTSTTTEEPDGPEPDEESTTAAKSTTAKTTIKPDEVIMKEPLLQENEETDSGIRMGEFSLHIVSTAKWDNGNLIFSLSLKPCGFGYCLHPFKIARGLSIRRKHHHKRSPDDEERPPPDLEAMDIDGITDQLANLNLPSDQFVENMNGILDGIRTKMCGRQPEPIGNFSEELKPNDEFGDKQNHPNGEPLYLPFFPPMEFYWPAGPVTFVIGCSAGAELGQDITADVQTVSSTVSTRIAPFIVGRVKASMAISIVIAEAGIELTGWLMRTKFPFVLEVNYAKLPAIETKKLLVELTPLELRLRGYVKILFFINIHFDIWHWRSPTLTGTIWKHVKKVNSKRPPRFPNCDVTKRDVSGTCAVHQIPGRHPSDTVFVLEVESDDDSSPVTLHYSIGTSQGGRDVRSLVEMKGNTITVPTTTLPNGVPLHFTIQASNTQGQVSIVACVLSTFDNTIPDGRIDAAYPFTSHRSTIQANIVVFEDSMLQEQHKVAVGYSPGQFGKEVVEWEQLLLEKSQPRKNVNSNLKYFSPSRKGKLTYNPMSSSNQNQDVDCATKCLQFGTKCVAFDYDMHFQTCNLQETVQGPNAKLVTSGSFFHYERLGVGYSRFVEYPHLTLEHGAQYYVNADVTNVLNYTSFPLSSGTLADFTPPEPGTVGDVVSEEFVADECKAAVTQRCVDQNTELNHRKIVDGPGSRTVFNGNRPLEDSKSTSANNFISGNCDGFHDDESGIWGYTWAAGTEVCGSDIVSFRNPHADLESRSDWTFTGLGKDLQLSDGQYYLTFQAINNVVHGGALVTTVCHSQPLTVDTSPPVVHEVGDLLFDEDFDILGVYFNVSDDGSGVERVDFGLGKTKYDVFVRSYSQHPFLNRDDPYLVIEDLGLQPGVQAWVRIRAVNNVGLLTASHGNVPILVDFTPPVAGKVLDGNKLELDTDFQHEINTICAQWIDFYDPESGIDSYIWFVGTEKGRDDIVPSQNFTHRIKSGCKTDVTLLHNTTYYSTVVALNGAINQNDVKVTSDGVLIDTTPPSQGYVQDGEDLDADFDFSSETATIRNTWSNFTDDESHIDSYTVEVFVNSEPRQVFTVGTDTSLVDHTMSMVHNDQVKMTVTATNGAGLQTMAHSDGYIVDETPPILNYLKDSGPFQTSSTILTFKWHFTDPESDIQNYRYFVSENSGGQKKHFWPIGKDYEDTETNSEEQNIELPTSLNPGATYSVTVSAFNRALLVTKIESKGVTMDNTNPTVEQVLIALPGEEEDLDNDGNVMYIEREPLHVSWTARDLESGVVQSLVCIKDGVLQCSHDDDFVNYGAETSVRMDASRLVANNSNEYYVVVRAVNGAGLMSNDSYSKQIKVQKANTPGTVFDGRVLNKDLDYQQDMSSLAVSFSGFESDSCGITGYDWGIGTAPYQTDVMRFTNYGLRMTGTGSGYAETSNTNFNNVKYFVTVRAITGEDCPESYIVSSSDGIIVDRDPPSTVLHYEDKPVEKSVIFQNHTQTLPISWSSEDPSGIHSLSWSIGQHPGDGQKHRVNSSMTSLDSSGMELSSGDIYFVTLLTTDMAGNENQVVSPPLTIDITPAMVKDFTCTDFVSIEMNTVACSWERLDEEESRINSIKMNIYTSLEMDPVLETKLSVNNLRWSSEVDIDPSTTKLLYAKLDVGNEAYLSKQFLKTITIDNTPPTLGNVKITTSGNFPPHVKTFCQIPTTFIEIQFEGFDDIESGISRYEVGLGNTRGSTDLRRFTEVGVTDGKAILNNLRLAYGMLVYVTVRVFNNAGVFAVHDGTSLALSPEPYVTVKDGPGPGDVESQQYLSVIQGRWVLSDPCPVLSAQWSVENSTGHVIKKFDFTPGNGSAFYSDEMDLKNMMIYIVRVKVVDLLNRTLTARSNGVTIRIQPPLPGHVRDGLDRDINYQLPTDFLSSNWDHFGSAAAHDISQRITHYEVAIGDDKRYVETRSNVHFFENVGLNTSYTFQKLNLTAKTKMYFITVRAFSEAGSYQEAFSNGIRVGYGNEIIPGDIITEPFQSSKEKIEVSWSDFVSDFKIVNYEVGIDTSPYDFPNGSIECRDISFQPYVPFKSVATNTIASINHLKLNHSAVYSVIVKAEDESGICLMAVSQSVKIDTTPPVPGDVSIEGGRSGGILYAQDLTVLHVIMNGFTDIESYIRTYDVQLLEGAVCSASTSGPDTSELNVVKSLSVTESKVHINNIVLDRKRVYYINTIAYNGAGLSTSVLSPAILVDLAAPFPGAVKPGDDWKHRVSSWSDTEQLEAIIGLNVHAASASCESQRELFTPETRSEISVLEAPFSTEAVEHSNINLVRIFGRLDSSLQNFQKGGLRTKPIPFIAGNYSFTLQPGFEIGAATVIALSQTGLPEPSVILRAYNKDFISNCSESDSESDTDCDQQDDIPTDEEWNFGLMFTSQEQTNGTLTLFWAKDKYKLKVYRILKEEDPREFVADYVFEAYNRSSGAHESWSIDLIINGNLYGRHEGLDISGNISACVFTWNIDGYIPLVEDPFNPFSTSLLLSSIKVPLVKMSLCRYGRLFSDSESGIRDIYVGLSDSQNKTASVVPYLRYKSFCVPCDTSCVQNCTFPNSCELSTQNNDPILPITLSNLSLASSSVTDKVNYTDTITSVYYIDVKVTDHAGFATEVKSDSVVIDTTPPVLSDVTCYDPHNSLVEPALFLGNDHSVATSWETSEDFSDVTSVYIDVGTSCGQADILQSTFFNVRTKATTLNLTETRLEEDKIYFVGVTVFNSAGLNATSCCNITTDFRVPPPAPADPQGLFTSDDHIPGVDVDITEYNDRIGLQWGDPSAEVEYFEWEVKAADNDDVIYPAIRVGSKPARRVEIIRGDIHVRNNTMNVSVAEYMNRNFSDGLDSSSFPSSPLSLEPGRCFSQTISHVSRSHKKTKMQPRTTCIKAKGSVYLTKETNLTNLAVSKDRVFEIMPSTKNKHDITITANVSRGALMVAPLTPQALHSTYGAPAAATYSSYIADTDTNRDRLSRLLTGRLVRFLGPSFATAPVLGVDLGGGMDITVAEPNDMDDTQQVALVFWDAESQMWRHVEERCGQQSGQNTQHHVTFEVCNALYADDETYDEAEAADEEDDYMETSVQSPLYRRPRTLVGAVTRKAFPNQAPVISTRTIHLDEDTEHFASIEYHDTEGDTLLFTIVTPPAHGDANITIDGQLFYRPLTDFNGDDSVVIKATEKFIAHLTTQPHILHTSISLNVRNKNDQPVSFFQRESDSPVPSYHQAVQRFYLEGNLTEHKLGSFWIADLDHGDKLELLEDDTSDLLSNFSLVQKFEDDATYDNLTKTYSKETISHYVLSLNTSSEYHGNANFSIRAKDLNSSYSAPLTVEVYVLINPCQHGSCAPTNENLPCNHPTRSMTFDLYRCECEAGYEGEFCQQEINECFHATCSLLYDCEDRLAAYECVLNTPKIIAIFTCLLLAVAGIGFLVRRKYKKMKSQAKVWDLPERPPGGQQEIRNTMYRPSSAADDKDIDVNLSNDDEDYDESPDDCVLEPEVDAPTSEEGPLSQEPDAVYQNPPTTTRAPDDGVTIFGLSPGFAPMPHRRGQVTQIRGLSDKDMPRVE